MANKVELFRYLYDPTVYEKTDSGIVPVTYDEFMSKGYNWGDVQYRKGIVYKSPDSATVYELNPVTGNSNPIDSWQHFLDAGYSQGDIQTWTPEQQYINITSAVESARKKEIPKYEKLSEDQLQSEYRRLFLPYYQGQYNDWKTEADKQKSYYETDLANKQGRLDTQYGNWLTDTEQQYKDALQQARTGYRSSGLTYSGMRNKGENRLTTDFNTAKSRQETAHTQQESDWTTEQQRYNDAYNSELTREQNKYGSYTDPNAAGYDTWGTEAQFGYQNWKAQRENENFNNYNQLLQTYYM